MAYGPYLRTKPRVQVLSGYDPMNPTGLKQTAPVKTENGEPIAIKSGQAIVLEWNSTYSQYEWVLATAANVKGPLNGAPAKTVYIAWQDSTDGDVVDGGLTGLSSSGDYEFQTAFFDAAQAYTPDTALTVGATAGILVPVPATIAGGATLPIVGRVVQVLGHTYFGASPGYTPVTGGTKLAEVDTVAPNQAPSVIRKEDSSTSPANSAVIRFRTSPGIVSVLAPG
jgi:hypothetical protein